MEDEEVAMVDGVFEGAFGALGDKTWFGNGSFSGCHGGLWWLIMDEEDDEVIFPKCVRVFWVRIAEASERRNSINAIDADEEITLVSVQDDADKEMFDVDALNGEEVFVTGGNENVVEEVVDVAQVSTAATTVTITTKEITFAKAFEALKLQTPRDTGKGILIEPVEPIKKKDLIRLDEEVAKIDADHQLAKRLQAQEQEELSIEEKAILFQQLLEKRRNHFNMEGYKLNDLKLKDFDSIQEMFDRAFKRVNTFEDFRTELVEGKAKRAGTELAQEITKKQKVEDDKETAEIKKLMEIILNEENASKACESLELLGEKISQEDVNQKLLRCLSREWNTHAGLWRNKANLDTMSMDDLYHNLKVYEQKLKELSSSSSRRTEHGFCVLFKNNTSRTNGASLYYSDIILAHGVLLLASKCKALRNQDNKNKESLTKSVHVETSTSTALLSCDGLGGYDWSDQAKKGPNYALMAFSSDSEVSNDYICSKSCLETVELLKSQNDQLLKDLKKYVLMVLGEITIRELRKKLETVQKEKDDIQLNVDKFEHASKSLNKLIKCQIVDNCKKGLGYENYNAVPSPYTGNFMPSTLNLSFTSLEEFVNEHVVENCKVMSNKEEPEVVRKNEDALIIKEWVSSDEEEDVSQPKIKKKTVRPSIVKKEFVKSKQQKNC
ncbi:hypothetical protein Tco_1427503 [Tanacetum coccineum]